MSCWPRLSCTLPLLLVAMATLVVLSCVGDELPSATLTGAGADAGADAGDADSFNGRIDATPDATQGFCERRGSSHEFCADFDSVTLVDEGWTVAEVRGAADSPVLAPLASSPPNAMKSVVHRTPDGGADVPISRLSYQKSFAQPGQHSELNIEFALYVEKADVTNRNAIFAGFEMPNPLALYLRRVDGAVPDCEVLVYAGTSFVGVLPEHVPLEKWVRVRLTLATRQSPPDGGAVGGSFTLGVNGQARTFVLPDQPLPGSFRADVGLAVSSLVGAEWTAYFDDVLIDGSK